MNLKKIAALSLALSFSFAGTSFINPNSTVALAQSQRLDLGVDTGKVSYQENTFVLNQNDAQKQKAMNQVRELRSKMWDENVIYTLGNSNPNKQRLQDVAKQNGYTSKSDYVNGLDWSTELEKIAIQRLFEQTITGLSHNRPDGSKYSTAVTKTGVRPYGEILANNSAQMTAELSFNQWAFGPRKNYNNKSEYELLKEANGVSNNGNGHIHLLLNPTYKAFAYADLTSSKTDRNFAVGLFGFKENSSNKSVNIVGEHTLYVGTPKKETEKPATEEKPKQVTYNSPFYKSTKTRDAYLKLTDAQKAELDKINTDGKAPLTVEEVVKSGKFNLPIRKDRDWIYPFMIDKDGDGVVGEAGLTNTSNNNGGKTTTPTTNKKDDKKQTTSKTGTLTAQERDELSQVVMKSEAKIEYAEKMIRDYPRSVKNVKKDLEKIIEDSKLLIKEAYKLLGN